MSAHHEIFIRSINARGGLVESLGEVIGAPLRPVGTEGAFSASLGNSMVDVAISHEYDDDYGISFSEYPIVITVRNLLSDRRCEELVAKEILDRLRKTGSYMGFLVFDLQILLAEI